MKAGVTIKNSIKITTSILYTMLFLISISSCSRPTFSNISNVKETAWNSKPNYTLLGTSSEDGYYYLQNGNYIAYFDVKTGANTIVCTKTGCGHNDGTCYAFVENVNPFLFVLDNKLYTIGYDLLENSYHLIRRDLDGNNVESVMTLMEDKKSQGVSLSLSEFHVSGHTLYYIGAVHRGVEQADNSEQDSREIYQVDLLTFQETVIYQFTESGGEIISVNEEQIIFTEWDAPEQSATAEDFNSGKYNSKEYLSSSQMLVKLWDKKTNKTTLLMQNNSWEFLGPIAAYENFLYYITWDEEHSKNNIYKLSLDSKESEQVMQIDGKIGNFVVLDHNTIQLYIEEEDWHLYRLSDFKELPLPLLAPNDTIVQKVKDGYIVTRVLEKIGDEKTYIVKKLAYSYVAQNNNGNNKEPLDFYIQTYQ